MSTIASRGKVGAWIDDVNGWPGGLATLALQNEPHLGIAYFAAKREQRFDDGSLRYVDAQTADLLNQWRKYGRVAGTSHRADGGKWYPSDAVAAARAVSDDIGRLNPTVAMLDVETHDTEWQRRFIAEYRRLRPNRWAVWSMEPRQSTDTVDIGAVLAAGMDIVVQCYEGDMTPTSQRRELDYWRSVGVPYERLSLFLDAKLETVGVEDGALFTAARWPALYRAAA